MTNSRRIVADAKNNDDINANSAFNFHNFSALLNSCPVGSLVYRLKLYFSFKVRNKLDFCMLIYPFFPKILVKTFHVLRLLLTLYKPVGADSARTDFGR